MHYITELHQLFKTLSVSHTNLLPGLWRQLVHVTSVVSSLQYQKMSIEMVDRVHALLHSKYPTMALSWV